jgi:phenylacetate-CoA ligase
VHPHQVAEILKRHPAVRKGRLIVDRDKDNDTMTLRCEIDGDAKGLDAALAESIQAVTKMRGAVEFVAPGSLPNDGKVIDDVRKYQ